MRLLPNTPAAVTAAAATAMAASAVRTGTAVRPWPRSKAICTPIPPATEPATPSAVPSREGRCRTEGPAGLPGRRLAVRQATGAATASSASTMTAKPTVKITTLTSIPGAGSASRAGPIGISGDPATAIATARQPPAAPTAPARASDSATSSPRVMPSARSTPNHAESRISWRPSSWPMMTSAITPASAAKSASATA